MISDKITKFVPTDEYGRSDPLSHRIFSRIPKAYLEASIRIIRDLFIQLMSLDDNALRIETINESVDFSLFSSFSAEVQKLVQYRCLTKDEYLKLGIPENDEGIIQPGWQESIQPDTKSKALAPLEKGTLSLRFRALGVPDQQIRWLPAIAASYGTLPIRIERWMREHQLDFPDLEYLLQKRQECLDLGFRTSMDNMFKVFIEGCAKGRELFDQITELAKEGSDLFDWRYPLYRIWSLIEMPFNGDAAAFVHYMNDAEYGWSEIGKKDFHPGGEKDANQPFGDSWDPEGSPFANQRGT